MQQQDNSQIPNLPEKTEAEFYSEWKKMILGQICVSNPSCESLIKGISYEDVTVKMVDEVMKMFREKYKTNKGAIAMGKKFQLALREEIKEDKLRLKAQKDLAKEAGQKGKEKVVASGGGMIVDSVGSSSSGSGGALFGGFNPQPAAAAPVAVVAAPKGRGKRGGGSAAKESGEGQGPTVRLSMSISQDDWMKLLQRSTLDVQVSNK